MKVVSLVLVLLLFVESGTALAPTPPPAASHETYIQQAIADFSSTRRFYRQDSVFDVSFDDTVRHRAVLRPGDGDGRYARWVPGSPVEGLVAVSILGARAKFLFTAATRPGIQKILPSRFLEKDGRLYLWWDKGHPLTTEVIAVLWKYKLFQDDQGGQLLLPDRTINDAQKGVTYYFCRKNPAAYKTVYSVAAPGYYEPPKLNCPQ